MRATAGGAPPRRQSRDAMSVNTYRALGGEALSTMTTLEDGWWRRALATASARKHRDRLRQ
eukprot:gene9544-23427_t